MGIDRMSMSIVNLYSAESWSISTALCVLSGNVRFWQLCKTVAAERRVTETERNVYVYVAIRTTHAHCAANFGHHNTWCRLGVVVQTLRTTTPLVYCHYHQQQFLGHCWSVTAAAPVSLSMALINVAYFSWAVVESTALRNTSRKQLIPKKIPINLHQRTSRDDRAHTV